MTTMQGMDQNAKASHFGEGNYFDNMRIDIAASHRNLNNLQPISRSIRKSVLRNRFTLFLALALIRLQLHELLITSGIRKKWLDDFRQYWGEILNGRPLWNTLDFFMLLHDYRKGQQDTAQLDWGDAALHLANWQNPSQLYSTMDSVRRQAIHPIVCPHFWKIIPEKALILEYGCSLAPFYHTYRHFYNHLDCRWVLADIPNFPFHYARYLYRNDREVELVLIDADNFTNPLGEIGGFDVIIITTVFEHLDDPLFVFDYLYDRLKPGGLLIFDYIKSEGTGLDHPNAVCMRENCLKKILKKTEIIYGEIEDIHSSVDLCIGRKKV